MVYSRAERSANARKQLRGKDGRWIYEGGSVKWWDAVKGMFRFGTVDGFDGDYVSVQIKDGPKAKVHRTNVIPITSKADLDLPTTDMPQAEKEAEVPDVDRDENGMLKFDESTWSKFKDNAIGYNEGGFYEAPSGEKYYVKRPPTNEAAQSEYLADQLYQAAGATTLDLELIDLGGGKMGLASRVQTLDESLKDVVAKKDQDALAKVHEDFAADAWLANWDAVGTGDTPYSNIAFDEQGRAIRVDPGGSLDYKGVGTKKPSSAFKDDVIEFDSMAGRGGPSNHYTTSVFGDISDEKRAESAKKVAAVTDGTIDDLVEAQGWDESRTEMMKATLKARRDNIIERAGINKPEPEQVAELPTQEVEEPQIPTDKDSMIQLLEQVGIGEYISHVASNHKYIKPGFWKTRKGEVGDVYTPHTDQDQYKILLQQLPNKNGDFWEVMNEDGSISKTTISHANQSLWRPTAPLQSNTPDAPEAPETEEVAQSVFSVLPKEERGKSGDGYHSSGPWGKFGASGVMIHAEDTDKFFIVQRGGYVTTNVGKWHIPGGAREENETVYQGAAREITEETSFSEEQISQLQHVGDVVFDNGKGWSYTNIAANLPNEADITVDPAEINDGKWVSADELRKMRDNGELVPAFGDNLDSILAKFDSKNESEVETVEVPEEEAEEIPLQPVSNVQGIGGKSTGTGIPTSDNGQGIVSHDNSQVSLSGVSKGDMTFSPQDIQSAGIGQKVYDPTSDIEWERTAIDTWTDDEGDDYAPSYIESLVEAEGLIWGSKDDYQDLVEGSKPEASQAPETAPRLSQDAADLNGLPEGSVVKFGDASDSKVYLKNADGSWGASWLDDNHPQKNVTSDQIHAVAAYLGKDVQVMKEDGKPNPQKPELEQWEKELLYGNPIGDFEIGDFFYLDDHVSYTKESEDNWEAYDSSTDDGASLTDDELIALLFSENHTPQKNVTPQGAKTAAPQESGPQNPQLLNRLGLDSDDELGDFLDKASIGSEIKVQPDSPQGVTMKPSTFVKVSEGVWEDKDNKEEWDEITLSGNFGPDELVEYTEGPGVVPTPDTKSNDTQGITEANFKQKLDEFPVGTSISINSDGDEGDPETYYKASDGSWGNLESANKYESDDIANYYYAKDVVSVGLGNPEEQPEPEQSAPAASFDIAKTTDGINIDSEGNQWVADKNGQPIQKGTIVVSKAGEKGKVDLIQKGGKKVRVKTEDGNTKFWNVHLVEAQPEGTPFDDSNNKYAVQTDENGKEYLNSPDGDRIYVGDTVVSSGKTGFEGEVVGFKSGEFVLVRDPSDDKVKPRKIDKIKLVSSANSAPTPESDPAATLTSQKVVGDVFESAEDLDNLPVGTVISIPDFTKSKWLFEKNDEGNWIDVTDPNDKGTHQYESSAFKKNFTNKDGVIQSIPGQDAGPQTPSLNPGDNLSSLSKEEFDALPVGFQVELDGPAIIYTKRDDGNWTATTEAGNPTSASNNIVYGVAKAGNLTVPEPEEDTAPGKSLSAGDDVNTKEEFDALEPGTVLSVPVFSDPSKSYLYEKLPSGKFKKILDPMSGDTSDPYNYPADAFNTSIGKNLKVHSLPGEETETSGTMFDAGSTVKSVDDLENAPSGSVIYMTNPNFPEEKKLALYYKHSDGKWYGLPEEKKTNETGVASNQLQLAVTNKVLEWDDSSPNTNAAPEAVSVPTTKEEFKNLPVGTKITTDPVSDYYYIKGGPNEWFGYKKLDDSEAGTMPFDDDAFNWPLSDNKIEFYEGGTSTPAPVSAPEPVSESLPGKNGKNIAVGATVSHPVKGGKGKVVNVDVANGNVTFLDENGKKRTYKAKFLNVDKEAGDNTPEALPKDPSSPWFEKEEPTAPTPPTDLRTDFALDGMYDEIAQNYLAQKNKEFSLSSYLPQFEQLSKNGSSDITTYANTGKYGDQNDVFDFFRVRGLISEETAEKAKAHFAEVLSANEEKNLKFNADSKQYKEDLAEWRKANGIPTSGFYALSFTPSANADEILKLTKANNMVSATQYADKHLPKLTDVGATKKDLAMFQIWVGGGDYTDYTDPSQNIPYVSWSSFSKELRTKGMAGHLDPSKLSADHAKVKAAITEAIFKSTALEDVLFTRSGDAINFSGPNGETFKDYTDLKSMIGSVITDYGVMAGSPGHKPGYDSRSMHIKIRVPKGAPIAWLGGKNDINRDEYEAILPPGSRFFVHDVRPPEAYYGKPTLILDMVPEDWTPAAGQTTGAVNKPGTISGPSTGPTPNEPSAPAAVGV